MLFNNFSSRKVSFLSFQIYLFNVLESRDEWIKALQDVSHLLSGSFVIDVSGNMRTKIVIKKNLIFSLSSIP